MPYKQRYGAAGELQARQWLEARGFEFIAANWRCRYGELDLVMRDGDCIVGVEVKHRRHGGQGDPAEAVTPTKLRHVSRALQEYVTRSGHVGGWRLDVVTVSGRRVGYLGNVTV